MPSLFAIFISALLLVPSFLSAETPFIHPGVIHDEANLSFVKAKIKSGENPWRFAWELLEGSRYLEEDWKPKSFKVIERGPYNDPDLGSSEFFSDSRAAYTNALHWALSGEEESAKRAAAALDAWSSTLESIEGHDARLLLGMAGLSYVTAAELLKHTWDGWPEEKQADFDKMLREIWYPLIKDLYPSANGNWDASMMQTIIAMAVYLDDRTMFDKITSYYLQGEGNGAVRNYFKDSGQCQESGRDQNHTQMGLEFLIHTCETAWLQKVDLYQAHDNLLLKGFEYTAKYNLGEKVPYEPYESFEERYLYPEISTNGRSRLRPMYEKVVSHYRDRQGLPTPYSEAVAFKTRPESGRGSSLLWSTLMFAKKEQPPIVPK